MRPEDIQIRRAFYAAYRDPARAVLEGFHPARHALAFGATLQLAVTYDRAKLLEIAGRLAPGSVAPIETVLRDVDRGLFDRLSPRRLSSPLLSIAERPAADVAGAFARRGRPMVFLDRPQDPGNVGAVIRVAAAADIEAVLVTGNVDPWSPVVIRSATGLQYAVLAARAELPAVVDRPVVLIDPGGRPLAPAGLDPSSILVVGGERYGVSPAVRERATGSVAVPMRPGVSSLNLATAVSAVLFSWRTAVAEGTGSPPW